MNPKIVFVSDFPDAAEDARAMAPSGFDLVVAGARSAEYHDAMRDAEYLVGFVDGLIVIEDGLRKGERVVVKGVQRSRPGRKVTPEEIDMASLTTSAMRKAAEEAEKAAQAKHSAPPPEAQKSDGEQ